ncbi:MAG TPA: alpha/beta hydrolase [Anaerolineales bacterium]|nr:alpha/beta hydrolase [Anaerolineales bacterium]
MSAVFVDGHLAHYEVLGRGRPLVLLHGWVGSWRYWIPTMQALSDEYRAYALDLWGFGDTERFVKGYALDAQAQLVRGFLEHLGVARAALVGHGLGGLVAARLAAHTPGVVERLVLVSVPSTADSLHTRVSHSSKTDLANWVLGRQSNPEALKLESQKTDPLALRTWAGPEGDLAWLPRWPQLRVPCLLVHGLKDPAVIAAESHPALSQEARNRLVHFPDSGHFPMLDEPAKFIRLVRDFLSLPSTGRLDQLQVKEEWKRRIR